MYSNQWLRSMLLFNLSRSSLIYEAMRTQSCNKLIATINSNKDPSFNILLL